MEGFNTQKENFPQDSDSLRDIEMKASIIIKV